MRDMCDLVQQCLHEFRFAALSGHRERNADLVAAFVIVASRCSRAKQDLWPRIFPAKEVDVDSSNIAYALAMSSLSRKSQKKSLSRSSGAISSGLTSCLTSARL